MKERFIHKDFKVESLEKIETANDIISDYNSQGYTLTLRQLYYQFVSKDLIPNSDREYKKLGNVISDARMAGLIDWSAIEDRGRSMSSWLVNEDFQDILYDTQYRFAADFWQDQDRYIEVWVEKDALSSVVERAVRPLRVGYMACKGYLSASEAYKSAKRMEQARERGKEPLVIHLGDHDPSGIDMTRDNGDRLALMSGGHVEVARIALNRDQIEQYNPPPNPAKITDSRAADYIAQHGRTSWELDALEPSVLVDLIKWEIEQHVDPEAWQDAKEREAEGKAKLKKLARNWEAVLDFADGLDE